MTVPADDARITDQMPRSESAAMRAPAAFAAEDDVVGEIMGTIVHTAVVNFHRMHASEAIRARRSIKRFADRPVDREQIETLLEAATLAPNHRLTNPWRFYVLGPEARYAYGLALGQRKAKKLTDPEAARAMRETVAREHRDLPCMIAIASVTSDNPEIREEDY